MSKTFRKSKKSSRTKKNNKNSTNNSETGYCVKCKKKQIMKESRVVKNMLKGVCPVCGTKMNRFIKMR
jgi:hypothetical protein